MKALRAAAAVRCLSTGSRTSTTARLWQMRREQLVEENVVVDQAAVPRDVDPATFLRPKPPAESTIKVDLEMRSDEALREQYRSFSNTVRLGKVRGGREPASAVC